MNMAKPRHVFGTEIKGLDLELTTGGDWNVEKDKSSEIEIFPSSGIIEKTKIRRLNFTIFEAYATIFFSELLHQYDSLFRDQDFTFYSPQSIGLEYGVEGRDDSLHSKLRQFLCPGVSLSQLHKPKEKAFSVNGEAVRVEDRVAYLMGALSEVFQREGVLHGDPQLRHFFLLPREGYVNSLSRDREIIRTSSRNGIGVIDVESLRIVGAYSEEATAEALKLKTRVLSKYGNTPQAEELFDSGAKLVNHSCEGYHARGLVDAVARETFRSLFSGSLVDKVDMDTGKIHYEKR